jgi:hypothetical protein
MQRRRKKTDNMPVDRSLFVMVCFLGVLVNLADWITLDEGFNVLSHLQN